ncbi:hypothetical protein Tco_0014085 [Tanacetum coccineum]
MHHSGHRLNPSSRLIDCRLVELCSTADFCCSKGGLEDKILVPKPSQSCANCGDPVDGLYCRSCAFVRKCLNEGWYTIHDENEILNTYESSNHNTNVFATTMSFGYVPTNAVVVDIDRVLLFMVTIGKVIWLVKSIFCKKKEEERRIAEDQAAKDRYWKIPICYDDDKDYTIAITPVLLTEETVDSLIMEDEHLDTIFATESDEVIKSSVEELVLIPSESEGISDGMCDVPLYENPTPLKAFKDHSEIVVDSNDDDTSSDDVNFEDIKYVEASSPNLEIANLEEVNDVDQEEEEFDLEDILQIQGLFPEYDSFHFEIEPDQGELTNVVMEDIFGEPRVHVPNVLPTHPTLMMDSDFIIRTFLPFFTYPVTSSSLLSSGNEDTIFDPGISTFHFSSLKPVAHENPIVIFLFFCFCPKDKGIRGEISQDHEDPCLYSILQSSGL